MRMRYGLIIAVMAAATLGPAQGSAWATGPAARSADLPSNVRQVCPQSLSLATMSCLALVRTDVPGHLGLKSSAPAGFGPIQLQSAYNLAAASASRGRGQTVKLIDAFDDPRAAADLAIYRAQFGLPPCDKATGAGCLTKVGPSAIGPLPRADAAWATQEAMDIDMVSAICPLCHILLQETGSTFEPDLEAVYGAKFISLGFAEPENPAFFDNVGQFAQQYGIAITAAAGDSGYDATYPASSQFVTAVGGTSLAKDAMTARGWTETAWSGTGGGCSAEQFQPAWQNAIGTGCPMRMANDVAAVADPETGVAFYDSYRSGGWGVGGGTDVSSAIIAAVYALAGAPVPFTYPASYPYRDPAALNDITAGSTGTCTPAVLCTAGPGFDGPTGLGSPNGIAAFGLNAARNVITLSPIFGRGLSLTLGHAIRSYYYIQSLDSAAGQRLTITGSGLPPGLSMTNEGGTVLLKGTPTKAGSFKFRLKALDRTGARAALTMRFTVFANAITITAPSDENTLVGTVATPVQIQASDSAPAQPLTFEAAHLPPGLSLTQTGPATATISGTARVAGRYGGLVTVTDSTGASQTAIIYWGVHGTLTFAGQPDQISTAGDPILLNFPATDSEPGAVVNYGETGPQPLGTGMDFYTGQISGWPSRPGVYHVTVLASDNYGASAQTSFTWTVKPAPQAGPAGPVRLNLAGMCLTDKNNAAANGTAVVISRCDHSAAQRWTVVQDSTLRINGKCLDTARHTLNIGAKAVLSPCTGTLSQQWRMSVAGELSAVYAAGCLTDPRASTKSGTQLVTEQCGSGANEQWTIPAGPIASLVPGKCVTDPGNAEAPGTAVVISSCDGKPHQTWAIKPDGTIRINGRCLDYARYGTARRPSVRLAVCTGARTQQWSNIVASSDLELEPALENTATSTCLDDPRTSTTDGTPLVLEPCPTTGIAVSAPGLSWRVS